MEENDAVGVIAQQWAAALPSLDVTPLLVVGRIERIAAVLDRRLRAPFAEAGIGDGDFNLLAALRRQPRPHELSAGELADAMLVTTGATTKRIDRLERQGHVVRRVAGDDARGRIVALTPTGRRLTDRLMRRHMANEAAALAVLSADEQAQLAGLLARLAASLDGTHPNR